MQQLRAQENSLETARPGRLLRLSAVVLSVAGLLVSLYLVFIKYNPTSTLCIGAGGCEAVNTSVYSEIGGMPIAALGALAYAFILALLLLEPKVEIIREWGPLAGFGTALAGTLYSAYLTYIEIAVIHAICPYCVTSAVILALLLVVTSLRLKKYI